MVDATLHEVLKVPMAAIDIEGIVGDNKLQYVASVGSR